jgi:hypothetical protein
MSGPLQSIVALRGMRVRRLAPRLGRALDRPETDEFLEPGPLDKSGALDPCKVWIDENEFRADRPQGGLSDSNAGR